MDAKKLNPEVRCFSETIHNYSGELTDLEVRRAPQTNFVEDPDDLKPERANDDYYHMTLTDLMAENDWDQDLGFQSLEQLMEFHEQLSDYIRREIQRKSTTAQPEIIIN